MDRRRLLQFAFSGIFILFLLLLAAKFRPKTEAPEPIVPEQIKHPAEGTLSARGFTYRQETAGKVEFNAVAAEVAEAPGGIKLLTNPVVTMASGAKAMGKRGSFNQADSTLRVWDDAKLLQPDGWTATSMGFRLTPEGEVVSEAPVTMKRGEVTGGAELMRYHRQTLLAHLDGAVHFEEGPKTLTCKTIDLDLKKHEGVMEGPVVLIAEQGTLKAPEGKIALDGQNRLKSVTMGDPALSDGPRVASASRKVTVDFDDKGEMKEIHLTGEASITSKGGSPFTARSERFDLTPGKGSVWSWAAPGAMTVERASGIAHAVSGTGTLGGKDPETADLAGPVSGHDARGDFTSDRAAMLGGDWTLIGHAEVTKPDERLTADRVTFRKDGSSEAEGSVRGWRHGKTQKEAQTTYTADRARAGAGGYPARLRGGAEVSRGAMTLKASSIKIPDENSALAEGDATATFEKAEEGTSTVCAPTICYAGRERVATAEGGAKGIGKGYTVAGELLRAVLDEKEKPLRYEAEGKASFEGTLYDGTGDFLSYDPATQAGQARGTARAAVVIQKTPYRRVSGPVVDFAPKRLDVLPEGGLPRRGAIEGVGASKDGSRKQGAGSGKREERAQAWRQGTGEGEASMMEQFSPGPCCRIPVPCSRFSAPRLLPARLPRFLLPAPRSPLPFPRGILHG